MYESHFGLSERPFSIAPDPQYLYMSQQHQEAMAHLQYGLTQGGGFILLTGEVGTGKTTLCRNLLNALPDNVDIALILNSKIQGDELLQTICDELKISYEQNDTHKTLLSKLNDFLLGGFAKNRRTVLIIDEAQLLSRDVLEQIRMLTNLETTKTKLLQIILIGQPELNELLARQDLRQLAQRITARYHLKSIAKEDIAEYVTTRLKVAGCTRALFTKQALNKVFKITEGIPRLINVLCDNSLLVAYSKSANIVDAKTVKLAAKEILSPVVERPKASVGDIVSRNKGAIFATLGAVIAFGLLTLFAPQLSKMQLGKPIANTHQTTHTVSSVVSDSVVVDQQVTQDINQAPELTQEQQQNVSDDNEVVAMPATQLDDLAALLNSPNIDTSRVFAFKRLAKLWGHDFSATAVSLCDTARSLGVDCYGGRTNLDDLLSYDRPASIVLVSEGLHRVIVKGANDNELLIEVNGNDYRATKEQVIDLWNGRYLIFWQRPDIQNLTLSEGVKSSRVVWLRQQINFALLKMGRKGLSNTSSTLYDASLVEVVRGIQVENGIDADGAINLKTMLAINTMIDSGVIPQLKKLGAIVSSAKPPAEE